MSLLIVTEAILYVCFSLLVGGLLTNAVPSDRKPPVRIPKPLLAASALSVGVLSFGPVYAVATYLAGEIVFWTILRSVVFDFQVGKAWLMTLAVSLILFFLISFNDLSRSRLLSRVAIGWAGLLIILVGWASHAASQAPVAGFIAHTLHFAAVCTWTGILLTIGWFSKEPTHWEAFLRWFTPLAIVCVVVAAAAGLWLMQIIVPEYVNSWLLPYGQALLVKHLLLVPLL